MAEVYKINDLSIFEKQQTIETIRAIVKARWFFPLLAFLQVISLRIIVKSTSLAAGPMSALLVLIVLGVNLLYWLYIHRPMNQISPWGLEVIKALQVIVDIFMTVLLIYFNGTVNTFTASFLLIVIMISSSLYKKKGMILSVISVSLIYTGLCLLEYFNLFLIQSNPERVKLLTLASNFDLTIRQIIVYNVYTVATGIFAGFLAGLNRRREKDLLSERDEANHQRDKATRERDKADQARRQEQIEKNEVEAVIRNLTAGLIMLDQKRKVILVNSQAEKMLGINRKNLFNKKLTEIKNDNLMKLKQLLSSAGDQQLEKKPLTFIGPPERYFEVSTAVALDPKQKPLGQIIVLNDISREKELDKTKSEFITITAHQLRTPLSGLKWALGIILDQDLGPINSKQKKVLQQGFASNEKMIDLISDLLNLTSLEEGRFAYNFSQASLSDLVQAVINDFQTYSKIKHVKIDFTKPKDDKSEAMIDVEKIKLVIQNLLENAINYSPANSTVTVTLERDNHDFIFAVKDLGMGIPDKEKPRLFTKFFRGETALKTETEGNGLGLYLAKNIITSHKGKIWYESQLGKGSTFYFRIPAGG